MREKRLVLPRITIRRLYEQALRRSDWGGSYRRALSILIPDMSKKGKMSFPEFKELVMGNLLSMGVGEALHLLAEKGMSLNPRSLKWALSRLGVRASETTCRNAISLLKGARMLEFSEVPVLVRDDRERILQYVRRRGCVRYSRLESLVPGARELVLKLIADGELEARYRGRLLSSLSGDWNDYHESLGSVPEEFLQEWEDDEGRMRRRVSLPGAANVCAKFD